LTRLLSTAFCVALLAATAGAFALTEKAKLQLSPIYATVVAPKVFSPNCNCATSAVFIGFRLRKPDTLTVWMERNGKRVRTLVSGHHYAKGPVSIEFNGISDDGLTLPDGTYQPVVHFGRSHLTLHLPSPAWVVLDTKPPVVHIRRRIYTHVSPGCACRYALFHVPFHLSEPGHGILLLNGKQQLWLTRGLRRSGTLVWNGKVNGVEAKQGNYVLYASAQDAAGNRAKPVPIAVVTVRYIQLGRMRVTATAGRHFAISVLTDARSYTWLFNRGHGTARGRTLRLRAPKKPATYHLYVTEGGHSAEAVVVVSG
jgi:hypothetical protein